MSNGAASQALEKQGRIAELTKQIEALERERRKLVYERCVLRRSLARIGTKHSPETIAKLRASHTGLKASNEARRKMSEFQRQRYADPEERENARQAALAAAQRRKGITAKDKLEQRIFGGGY